jgi:hypothetical protein
MESKKKGENMGWFGKLIGTDKAIDNLMAKDGLLDKAGSWVGGLTYTEEEKAEADAATREWGLRQLEALAPFKVVQRIGFFTVCAVWVFMIANVLLAIWLQHPSKEEIIKFAFSDFVFWPTVAVFSLYYTGGVFPRKASS